MPLFTVFTPTYNRAHTIGRVYQSLVGQTCRDFEWLIVDDGSSDNTRELVEGWQRTAPFPIRYIWQPNGGKHVAHNRGVQEAAGALFLTLDSDDACVPEALERLRWHWEQIPATERDGFSAVTGLCRNEHGDLIGTTFPRSPLDGTPMDLIYRYRVTGEKWGFQRTDVLRQYPFPTGRGVMPEGLVWCRIAKRYRTRYVNEVWRIYHQDVPSLMRGPYSFAVDGTLAATRMSLVEHWRYARFAPLHFVFEGARYVHACLHARLPLWRQMLALNFPGLVFCVLGAPIGIRMYVLNRRRLRLG